MIVPGRFYFKTCLAKPALLGTAATARRYLDPEVEFTKIKLQQKRIHKLYGHFVITLSFGQLQPRVELNKIKVTTQ